jgi:hypothetical protein
MKIENDKQILLTNDIIKYLLKGKIRIWTRKNMAL